MDFLTNPPIYEENGIEINRFPHPMSCYIVTFFYAEGEYYNVLFNDDELPKHSDFSELMTHMIMCAIDLIGDN